MILKWEQNFDKDEDHDDDDDDMLVLVLSDKLNLYRFCWKTRKES